MNIFILNISIEKTLKCSSKQHEKSIAFQHYAFKHSWDLFFYSSIIQEMF